MLDVIESDNYIKIIEDDAELDSLEYKLINAYPNNNSCKFDCIVLDFDITLYGENDEIIDYYNYNVSEFEEVSGEKEYFMIVDRIVEFIKTNPFNESFFKVRIVLKKIN